VAPALGELSVLREFSVLGWASGLNLELASE
jgi:hypothetical protein